MNAQPVILVIDDVVDNITVLAEHLAPLAAVQFATSGPEGLFSRDRGPDGRRCLAVLSRFAVWTPCVNTAVGQKRK